MKTTLNWDKPQKQISIDKWKSQSFDGGPPGAYQPNMSTEDRLKWKAKKINVNDPRIEIRKTFEETGANVLIVVRKNPKDRQSAIEISTNGKIGMSWGLFFELNEAVKEAMEILL